MILLVRDQAPGQRIEMAVLVGEEHNIEARLSAEVESREPSLVFRVEIVIYFARFFEKTLLGLKYRCCDFEVIYMHT